MVEDPYRDDDQGKIRRRPMSEAERQEAMRLHWNWLQFIAMCAVFGITLGVAMASVIVHTDISGIGSMLSHSPNAVAYKLLLAGGLSSTFGMVSMGIGIMVRSQYF